MGPLENGQHFDLSEFMVISLGRTLELLLTITSSTVDKELELNGSNLPVQTKRPKLLSY